MKLNIFTKLFMAVLLAAVIVIVFMVVFMNWSFRQGFADYQRQSELASVGILAGALAEAYQRQPIQNWAFLRNNPRSWQSALMQIGEPDPDALRSLSARLRLRDDEGTLVFGRPQENSDFDQVPVRITQQIVGWLELDRQAFVTSKIANSFMQQQARNIYLIALFATLLSLLITLIVVRQLLVPVKQLTDGAKSLASGNFSTHISVNSNDELGELATRFNQLADSLERNEELRSQWIADISHELRTPIAVLRSEIEAMLDGIREPNLERIRSLHADTLSLGKLVEDLYQLSLSDSVDPDQPDELVDLGELLSDLLIGFEARLQEKQIRLEQDIVVSDTLLIKGDYNRLYQLFSNLLENSYRYTHEKGRVRVIARHLEKQIMVEVSDSTPGVPDAALPRLFDRLYRVDKSRSRLLGGSGLGLSICKNIVKIHQGEIIAGHSPEGGLAIKVLFQAEGS